MRDISAAVHSWFDSGESFALATVTRTWRSSPRRPGAAMAVNRNGEVVGSVSGGCIESSLYETARDVLADGNSRIETFDVSDDDAFGVGLTCGGRIEVLVELVGSQWPSFGGVCERLASDRPVAVLTTLVDGEPSRHLVVDTENHQGDLPLPSRKIEDIKARLRGGESDVVVARLGTDQDILVEIHAPLPRMYVFGAIDFASAVSTLAVFAGYHVTVVDARPVFATPARFPAAHEVVVMWPDRFLATAPVDSRTAIVVLTHDEKFDIPLLNLALRSDAGYVGAMGSRSTHERRVGLLRDHGITPQQCARLHSPIGLDLGSRTPAETALAVLAEVTKTMNRATGEELRHRRGPIHGLSSSA
ncbi:XdhC family protein [Rhodococcus sp. BP-252]|uniref:XdhC family protein n=1 Tax=unclassified Rhodococcus (in: high G+C Gram-positive bacteria) TaxID=192944 RepID=UPI001C9A5F36|nr:MULTISPECIES: XdhC/CoxI family protein [unclassified Rhodococcus (in: high G+C Gram-positive bacteria)]MBY6414135.1 XdhC family protein [Rhodococcus sp. BP-320]MBY6418890.1 XdhC family protein [Rhodococcus sp. BP-321]MBY6423587.1 XdhC family protein [Rhodococcus sp. BP-324]MBY6428924.1 XdhC family protein [Rhodococcus sp. BP-323]MBY6433929.1 XdhC family protein [Rhodococcus sp. BP-322]